ncbi:MAG: phage virion morphogenesis protein [Flavobacteriales bacterium]|jgi:phage gpG-like protein|nr:phage virion morphogenesis protein [Flavobacteriales bacterium]
MANQFQAPDFNEASKAITKLTNKLPKQIGAIAEQFFKESFENQGFTNNTLIPWKGTNSGKANKFGKKSEGILINSGTLKRSISFAASKGYVEVSVDGDVVPYAKIHNEGGMVSFAITDKSRKFFWFMFSKTSDQMWKAMALTKKTSISFKMPKRQFIGKSAMLNKQIEGHILKGFKTVENELFNPKFK